MLFVTGQPGSGKSALLQATRTVAVELGFHLAVPSQTSTAEWVETAIQQTVGNPVAIVLDTPTEEERGLIAGVVENASSAAARRGVALGIVLADEQYESQRLVPSAAVAVVQHRLALRPLDSFGVGRFLRREFGVDPDSRQIVGMLIATEGLPARLVDLVDVIRSKRLDFSTFRFDQIVALAGSAACFEAASADDEVVQALRVLQRENRGGPDGSLLKAGAARAIEQARWDIAALLLEARASDEPDPSTSAELLALASKCYRRGIDSVGLLRAGSRAVALARSASVDELAHALVELHRGRITRGQKAIAGISDNLELRELESLRPQLDRRTLAAVDVEIAGAHHQAFQASEAERALRRVDRRNLDQESSFRFLECAAMIAIGRLDFAEARARLEELSDLARHADDDWFMSAGQGKLAALLYWTGDLRRAAVHARLSGEFAARMHDWAEHAAALGLNVQIAAARGELQLAVDTGERAWQAYERADHLFAALALMPALSYVYALRGDGPAEERTIVAYRKITGLPGNAVQALCRFGVAAVRDLHPKADIAGCSASCAVAEASFLDPTAIPTEQVRAAMSALDRFLDAGLRFGFDTPAFLPRLRARASAALGLSDAAEHFRWATEQALSCGAEAEVARCLADQGALARRLGDLHEARRLVDEARTYANEIGAIGLLPFLERERSEEPREAEAPRYFLFTDIVGSTALNASVGDDRWLSTVQEHDRRAQESIDRWRGVRFKHTGDGLHVWFSCVDDALLCALSMQASLSTEPLSVGERSLELRCAVVGGTAKPYAGDYFGTVMSVAARLCDVAPADGVLTTDEVAQGASTALFAFGPTTAFLPKGLTEPIQTLTVRKTDQQVCSSTQSAAVVDRTVPEPTST